MQQSRLAALASLLCPAGGVTEASSAEWLERAAGSQLCSGGPFHRTVSFSQELSGEETEYQSPGQMSKQAGRSRNCRVTIMGREA